MLFKFNRNSNLVLEPEALKLTSHIKFLTKEQLHYIILFCDYSSKYHQYPDDERRWRAKNEVFKDRDFPVEEQPHVKEAMLEYTGLQFDMRRETLRMYQNKMIKLQQMLVNEEQVKKITDYDTAIERLQKRCDEIQKQISYDSDEVELRGKGKQTFIEKWQKKQVEHKNYLIQKGLATGVEVIDY